MAIDLERVLGVELAPTSFSWDEEDVILYHLGIGAGDPPTDPGELRYAYEGDLHVLPTYATIPQFSMMMSLALVDGMDINPAMILHGEHEVSLDAAIPTSGEVSQTGRITDVFDKGKGALVVIEIESVQVKTGERLFTNRASIFVRGEGGFGGESGPSSSFTEPGREPDHVVESPTLPQQALLYRMASGDKNPLHADPGFAAFAGFEKPILHGLCTYGIVAKAAVDRALGGSPEAVRSFGARFSGALYPGETIVTRIWDEGNHLIVSATCRERGTPVVSNGVISRV
ncbi:MAG: MaoC/PaaZ C-terminal domain-containing protein [Acidimicrobiia bacterium]